MTENDRPRGVTVYPMPESAAGPFAYGRYALMVRRDERGKVDTSEVRMVHTEGVAYAVREDKLWTWNDYNPECPSFTPMDLIQCIQSEVDLADWVRTFGARLESNFDLCYRWATNGRYLLPGDTNESAQA